uniref:histone deacetylase n=1 Tax=Dendrobium officinale TaxID=142615 RepID=A0A1J0CN47_DENOF|nr:histone deacetylase 5 [Dendrobium officinale]
MNSSPEDRRSARVGLAYDERMCLHATPDGESHPENPERIRAIWRKLEAEGIPDRCILLKIKEAEDAIIASVHTRNHIKLIRNISSKKFDSRRLMIASKLNSIYFNEGSSKAAYLAAGTVIEATENVANGNLDSAIAVVRPPGHHAEANEAMGFCLFNNVAIAASYLLNERAELSMRRILIVDWDVHHGNGTQNMFYSDPRVLYFSVHRFDFGSFYPAGSDGSHCMIGEDQGVGYNINVPWEHGQCGDADYLAVWDHILIPVAEAYNPDIILISAGFDAAMGDPLGGCCVTPYGYSVMLKRLMKFADGKIVLALEGGYNLNSLANSVFACAKTLLEGSPIVGNFEGRPFESTWRVINEVRNELKTYWPVFSIDLPEEILIANVERYPIQAGINSSSDSDVEKDLEPSNAINFSSNNDVGDLILPLSKLNVDDGDSGELSHLRSQQNQPGTSEAYENSKEVTTETCNDLFHWRSSLSKVDVWYGSYGSNMWKPRFLCYIEGGKVEGMTKPCRGALDKTPPKDIIWKSVPHRFFFARSYSNTWGHGGVAFLNPQSNINDKSYMCIYRITLEQFNDLLIQENAATEQFESPLVDSRDIEFLVKNSFMSVESIKGGWYSNILYLGEQDGIPILTMTCSLSDVEKFKSGELPVCAPPKAYENTLLKGLLEGTELSSEEAIGYLKDAVARNL